MSDVISYRVLGIPPGAIAPTVRLNVGTERDAEKLKHAYPKGWSWKVIRVASEGVSASGLRCLQEAVGFRANEKGAGGTAGRNVNKGGPVFGLKRLQEAVGFNAMPEGDRDWLDDRMARKPGSWTDLDRYEDHRVDLAKAPFAAAQRTNHCGTVAEKLVPGSAPAGLSYTSSELIFLRPLMNGLEAAFKKSVLNPARYVVELALQVWSSEGRPLTPERLKAAVDEDARVNVSAADCAAYIRNVSGALFKA